MRLSLSIACLAVLALLSGCGGDAGSDGGAWFRPIRYRLTATVETPQGERSGYSIIESQTNRRITRVRTRGEAVAVDLPDGQVLYVLLRSPTMVDWAATLPGIPVIEDGVVARGLSERQAQLERQLDAIAEDRRIHHLWGGDVPTERAQYLPYMVRFRNPADPKTVEQVDPTDLAKSFGPGYRLKSLTTQVTDEPVTDGIEQRLVWLRTIGRERGTLVPNPPRLLKDAKPVQLIAPSDFSTELYK